MSSTKGLQRILRKRLPKIDRWRQVHVYKWDSPHLPWFVRPTKDMLYIIWSNPKGRNVHSDETKEIPLADLDKVIEKNKMRLRNSTKQYK